MSSHSQLKCLFWPYETIVVLVHIVTFYPRTPLVQSKTKKSITRTHNNALFEAITFRYIEQKFSVLKVRHYALEGFM